MALPCLWPDNLLQFCCLQNGHSDAFSRSRTPPSVAAGLLSASPPRLCPSCQHPEDSGRRKAAGGPGWPGAWTVAISCVMRGVPARTRRRRASSLGLGCSQTQESVDLQRGRCMGTGPGSGSDHWGLQDTPTLRTLGPLYRQEMEAQSGGAHTSDPHRSPC